MYTPSDDRYASMTYRRAGVSGLKLPAVSLGLWHNFGDTGDYENMKAMCFTAFDNGITHFDLANNYGPEAGSAERNLGRIIREELGTWRDELIVSTKAGYGMWEGPYGDGGSRKYLLASLDQSLKRLGLEYVDIFYHHRPDYDTPLEETKVTGVEPATLHAGSFRRFSPCRRCLASARLPPPLRKSLENSSAWRAKQFLASGFVFGQGKARREYFVYFQGF